MVAGMLQIERISMTDRDGFGKWGGGKEGLIKSST